MLRKLAFTTMHNRGDEIKCYHPNAQLKDYLKTKLQLETERQRYKEKGEPESDALKKRIRANDAEKVRILDDIIFPSMASLTYFFQVVAFDKTLRSKFDDDLKDLFGINRINPKKTSYGFMFSIMINSILQLDNRDEVGTKSGQNFRVNLMKILQELIQYHFRGLMTELNLPSEASYLIIQDFLRIIGWMSVLEKTIGDNEDAFSLNREYLEEKKRDLVMHSKNTKSSKEKMEYTIAIEECNHQILLHDKYVEKIKPGRTFEL